MDGASVTLLAKLCSTITTRALSCSSKIQSIDTAIDVTDAGSHNVNCFDCIAAALQELGPCATELEEALNAATFISDGLSRQMSLSLASCDGAMSKLEGQLMRVQPRDVRRLDSTALLAHSDVIKAHTHLFVSFKTTLLLNNGENQDNSLALASFVQIREKTESALRLSATATDVLYIDDISNYAPSSKPTSWQGTPAASFIEQPLVQGNTSRPHAGSSTRNSEGFSKGLASLTQSLKTFTSDLRKKPSSFVTELCQEVMSGNEEKVAELIAQDGGDINSRNKDGDTPLKCAIISDQAGATRLLLAARSIDVSASRLNMPPLFYACSVGSLDVAALLLSNDESVHDKNQAGQPYFVNVVESGNVSGVRFLLEHGADVNAKSISGQEIIVISVLAGDAEVVGLLLEHGAKANASDIAGDPILAVAVNAGDAEIIELLITHGADAKACGQSGAPILVDALARKRIDIARLLLAGGANAKAKDASLQPILINVVRDASLKDDEKVNMVRLLLDHGADVNSQDHLYGVTALCHALESPNVPLVTLLLKHGASTNGRMVDGRTPLAFAIDFKRNEQIKTLLKHGVDVNYGLNRTPLTQAVLKLDYEITKLLVEHGADIKAPNNDKALRFVKSRKRKDFLELLCQDDNPAAS